MDEKLQTSGDLARDLGQPFYKIAYLIRTRNIEPAQRAGGKGLYGNAARVRIARALADIDTRRTRSNMKFVA